MKAATRQCWLCRVGMGLLAAGVVLSSPLPDWLPVTFWHLQDRRPGATAPYYFRVVAVTNDDVAAWGVAMLLAGGGLLAYGLWRGRAGAQDPE